MTPKEYIEEFDNMPLCYDDGEFIRGQTQFKNHMRTHLIRTVVSVLKEQACNVEKLIPDICNCPGRKQECEHWGKHEMAETIRLSLENKIKEWELLDNK